MTDSAGRQVSVRLPVRRIVALTGDSMEALRILGAGERVVGVNRSVPQEAAFWPEFLDAAVVGNPFSPNLEKIAALRPDLVIGYVMRPGPELEKKLIPLGISVLRLDFYRMSTVAEEVATLGRLLETPAAAEIYAGWLERHMGALQAVADRAPVRPRVFVESYSAFRASGPGTSGFEMCRLAGGDNVTAELAVQAPLISSEWISAKDPEVIIKLASLENEYSASDSRHLAAAREEIIDRKGWHHIRAVRDGRVYVISGDVGPGPRGVVGIAYMTRWLFPEFAGAIDPSAIHKEYMEKFQGMRFQGHYAYP